MRISNCCKDGLARCLVALVIWAMLNTSGLHAALAFASESNSKPRHLSDGDRAPTNVSEQSPLSYGVGPDKVPFALKADGTKAKYLSLCVSHIKLRVEKEKPLGEVEFLRVSPTQTLVTFKPTVGDTLSVRSAARPKSVGQEPSIDLSIEMKGKKVALSFAPDADAERLAGAVSERSMQTLRADVKAQDSLTRLLAEAHDFLSEKAFLGLLPFLRQFESSATDCAFQCVLASNICIGAVLAYAGGIGTLIFFCGETLGFTCILALASHPFLATAVGLQCTSALNICRACRQLKPNSDEMDLEMMFW